LQAGVLRRRVAHHLGFFLKMVRGQSRSADEMGASTRLDATSAFTPGWP
jgi:hypothetical protein